ncbi:MAG: EamA family transporter [Gammaproteobacteria bacterium]|nr:EamA family transporter [Gammaproteobacteria bacterium]
MSIHIFRPEVIVAAASALWGLFWIPLRAFEQQGLDPGWVTIAQFVAPLICLLPFALIRLLRNQPSGVSQITTGLLIGAAFALYCQSLMLTDVVRALILFYVMPAWGTIAEVGFMGRKFTFWRGVALVLSMFGLLTILGIGGDFSLALNSGDVMALVSGVVFTIGAMRVRQTEDVSVFEQLFAFFLFGALVSLGLLFLFSSGGANVTGVEKVPPMEKIVDLLPWFLLMAVVFLIPVMWGIYWGSGLVDPGRLGILLQLEAVVGIISAALLAGEPFGWRELIGAVLVVSAGLVEVFGNQSTTESH